MPGPERPGWAPAIVAEDAGARTVARLVSTLQTVEVTGLEFCRLLERWARGEADPATVEGRVAALRAAARRVDQALGAVERPLGRFLERTQPERPEGASWFGEPSIAELVDWEPVLARAGVPVPPHRVAAAYLELAVLVRALEGLGTAVEVGVSPDRASLWVGLFDLRENLLGRLRDDVRALAA